MEPMTWHVWLIGGIVLFVLKILTEGIRQAKILMAEGQAEALVRMARAEGQVLALVREALRGRPEDPAHYLIAMRYLESLKEMVSGQHHKVICLPYEATGILGSLGGLRELLERGTQARQGPSSPSPCFSRRSSRGRTGGKGRSAPP